MAADEQESKFKQGLLYYHRYDFIWKNIAARLPFQAISQLVKLSPDLTGNEISSNLPEIQFAIKRSDTIFELSDGSFLIIEFQSAEESHSPIKFLRYGIDLAELNFEQNRSFKPIKIIVLYSANVEPLPPTTFVVTGSVTISFEQISLGEKIDGKKLIDTIKSRFDFSISNPDKNIISPSELAELYLAPFGRITIPYEQFVSEYLSLGAKLSNIFKDPSIFASMLVTIPEKELRSPFEKEFEFMYQAQMADFLTEGEFSQNKNELKAKDAEIKAQAMELEANAMELKAKDARFEAARKKLEATVVKLYNKKLTIQEISVTMSIGEEEVTDILKFWRML
ncbi:MAG: hypothetical protein LBT47_10630 [Deltaproteobacteria bacterium]|nr:hypothetical protein [Deltaproteobacteria bacterium]